MRWFLVLAAAGILSACGGPPPKSCSPTNCTGCCDPAGVCQSGLGAEACGANGGLCTACFAGQSCAFGICRSPVGGGAGGGSAGGTAGGTGGGTAGGTAGGAGGGSGGGTAGGFGGGTAGGFGGGTAGGFGGGTAGGFGGGTAGGFGGGTAGGFGGGTAGGFGGGAGGGLNCGGGTAGGGVAGGVGGGTGGGALYDTCSSPGVVTTSAPVTGTTVNANNDYGSGLSGLCGSALPGPDVVYSFTPAVSGTFQAVVTGGLSVFVTEGVCGASANCIEASLAGTVTFHAVAGTTYFLVVDSTSAPSPFTLTLTQVTSVPNDGCATATPLTLGVATNGTTAGSVNDLMPSGSACGSSRLMPEVLYSFTPSTSGNYTFAETGSSDVVLWLSSGTCGGATCSNYTDSPEQIIAPLNAGTTYYLVVEAWSYPGAPITVSVNYNSVPPNDTCAAPGLVTTSAPVSGTTLGANDDYGAGLSGLCGAALPGPDVVYAFTPSVTGTYQAVVSSSGLTVFVTSGSCGAAGSCLGASLSGTVTFHAQAGTPYYLVVDSTSAILASTFTLTVTQVASPPNDLCSGATPLTLGVDSVGTTAGSVNDLMPGAPCSSSRLMPEVVYSFTPATTGDYTFVEKGSSDVVLWLSNGTCGGATCSALIDSPEQLTQRLTAGTTYYLVVEAWSYPGAPITVGVSLNVPPANDTCASPQAISPSTTVSGTTLGATDDYGAGLSGLCGTAQAGPDVVYSFVAPTTGVYQANVGSSGLTVYVTEATCGAPSRCLGASLNGTLNFRTQAGTTYYLIVDSSSASAASAFGIVVAPVTGVSNDTCATATPLTLNVPVAGTLIGAVNDLIPAGCCSYSRLSPEVIYSFTPTTSGNYTFTETGGLDVVLWVSEGTCGTNTCLTLTDSPETVTRYLTAGTTYFLVVETWSYPGGAISVMVQ